MGDQLDRDVYTVTEEETPDPPPADGLFVFARFHARPGREDAVAAALRDVLAPTRAEPGNLGIQAFRSVRDARLFYIHSRWCDETAFEAHGAKPHTVRFIDRIEPLIGHGLDVSHTVRLG